ncbi:IPT/TIG domain-containing protein [Dyella acidiphila]|uniref:IPT/TIG domain-containing protein n=1 Tax=Dyella acidiphila TaxID=2775866 RepID=A0ABR9GED6_9GAMM|nr:IPT/TIG domain-containing protein [Dyella acidiphila]MBE1162354.1 IPT/TIG domain-containing protein [Dyella acidiphila]
MESQSCGAVKDHTRRGSLARRRATWRRLVTWATWLLCAALLWSGAVQAQSTGYVYDANGRVVATTVNNGSSVQYSYNSLGHVSQVSAPLTAGQLAIFAFMPTHGEAGTQVTIEGQGFSSNAAADTVSFNGTVATVLSATANQLVTTVPDGASSGPISVTVGGQTVASATPFVIDDTGLPPSITQVSPVVVSVGNTVTLSGAHLDPVAGDTSVQMGDREIPSLAAITDTQVQYTVPSNGTSGNVTVATPYGMATSPTPVVVLPSSISAANVVSSGNAAVNGAGVNLNIGASGQYGAVTFTAPQSGWVSLQASAITTTASGLYYTVYAPGNSVLQQGSISSSSPSVHLPHLLPGAVYLVVVQPSGAGAQLTMGVESNSLLTIGNAATVVTTVAGASERVLFNATAGQNLAFQINGTTTNPSGHTVTYTVYSPSGASYTSGTTASTGVINLGNLPTAGTYQVVVAPGSGVTGSMQVEVAAGVTGTLNGTPQNYVANVAGQNIYLSFTATQGESLELTLYNVNDAGATYNQFPVYVYNAAGAQVASFWCYASNPGKSCTQHLWYLPAGAYSVVATPYYGGVLSFTALLEQDLSGGNIPVNGTAAVALAAGQVERYTFTANAGDTVALNVSGITTAPTGQGVAFLVYRPDAGAITTSTPAYTSFTPTGSQTVNLPNLPVSGTYTIIAAPSYGLAASGQISVVGGATATLPTNGSSQTYTANVTGENVYLTFTATQGQSLELALNNVNAAGAQYNQFIVYVYNAAGGQVASFWCYASNPGASCNQHLWYLPAGTYSVVASPYYGGVLSFNALIQPDIDGGTIADNTPVNIALGAGQVERYTFNANAGDTVALNVSGITTTPAGQGVTFLVYRPDAGAITTSTPSYTSFGPTSAQTVNLQNLPISGAYTVIVTPNYGLAGSAQFEVVSGATGTLQTSGTAQSYTANTAGQNVYLSFTATQGQNLELALNNVNAAGAQYNQFIVYVYNAAGGQVTSFWCYASNPGASCNAHLWDLPAGTYSVVVSPYYGGVLSFNALLQPDLDGGAITDNTPVNISLGAGQSERYTFNANAGDTIALNVSGITTTPAGQPVNFQVYRPDAGVITTSTSAYTSFNPTSSQVVNLQNLPVSGAYTVIVTPYYALPATAQLNVVTGATGTLSTDGTVHSYTANTTGQNVYLSFNATQGQNLELTLNNVNAAGAQYNQFIVYVYNAAGGQVTSFWCYASNPNASCNAHLWDLPAGTYSVVASPYYGGVLSFNALLQPDLVGPALAANTPANISLSAGQVGRYTFNANAGDTIALNVSGVTTTPAGQQLNFQVYRPDAGVITTNTSAYTTFAPTSGQLVNLPNLPVSGTYTVIVTPYYGLAASAQLTLVSGATGNLPSTGTSQHYSANAAGENVYLSFNATQGQNLELTLNNVAVVGGQYSNIYVNVYNAAGNSVATFWCYASNPSASCSQHLWSLAAGQYSVVVNPYYGGVISFNALIEPDITGASIGAGDNVSISLNAGQVERYTFSANAGDTVTLNASAIATTPVGQGVNFTVYRPDNGVITNNSSAYSSFTPSGAQTLTLSNLPVSGTYTVIVSPSYGLPADAQLNMQDTAAAPPTYSTPTLTDAGSSVSETASASGQTVNMTFNANSGDNLELQFADINVPGGNVNAFRVDVYDPSGAQVTWAYCYNSNPASSCRFPLWNLRAGSYSVVATPTWGGTISFSAQLQPDIVGPALSANTPATVTLGAGQVERLTFSANQGDTVALNLSGVSTTAPAGQTVYVNVYRPDTGLISTGNYYTYFSESGSGTLNLQNLPASGTYTAVVYTSYGTPGTAQLTVAPGATGTVTTNAAAQSFAAQTAGENVYLNFNANQGDNLELQLSNITLTGGSNNGFRVDVYSANGTDVSGTYCYTSNPGASCRFALWNLPAGSYSVVASPTWGGTIGFNAQLQSDVAGPALTANTPATVTLGSGQIQRFTFNANVGDTVALNLSAVSSTAPTGQGVYVNVYRPDTGAITTGNYYTYFSETGSGTLNLPNLPASGTYTAVVYTNYGTPATAQLTLAPGATGTVTNNGAAQNFAANIAGENVYFNFNANLGDNLELQLSNITVTGGSNNGFRVDVYNSVGNDVSGTYCYTSNPGASCRFALWNLPAGTYSVVVSPTWGGTIGFTAQLQSDVTGSGLTMGTPASINLGVGQVQRLTFNANVGDTVALNLSGVSTTAPAGQGVYVNLYRPDTGAITTGNNYTSFSATSSSTINLQNLPASGTYTAVVYTNYGTPGSAQLTLVPGVTGTVATNGPAQSFQATAASQNIYFNFNANLGDNLELQFSNIATTGASNNGFRIDIYNSTGTDVAGNYCYTSNPNASCRFALWNLPAGTYSVVVSPTWGGVIGFTAQLQSDSVGPALAMSTPATVNLAAGQVQRLTFNANVGDTIALNLSGVSTTSPTGQGVYVNIYRPDTGAITTGNNYTSFSATSSSTINLQNLPATGTYTAVVYTNYGTPGTAQLTMLPGLTGTVLSNGVTQNYAAYTPGENAYLNFNANLGDNLELTLSNINVVGASNNGFHVDIYNVSGNDVSSTYCYASSPGAACRLALWNLPAGAYSVEVEPIWGGTMNFTAQLQPDGSDGALTANVPSTINLGAGSVQRITFNASVGQNVVLTLAGVSSTSPTGQTVAVNVYRPDTGAITTGNYYNWFSTATSSTLTLSGLPATGTYTAVVYTSYGTPATAQLSYTTQ